MCAYELLKEIEIVRHRMNQLATKHHLTSVPVLEASMHLDQLLNKYKKHRIIHEDNL